MCNKQGGKIITPHYDIIMSSLTVVFLSDFRLKYDVYDFLNMFCGSQIELALETDALIIETALFEDEMPKTVSYIGFAEAPRDSLYILKTFDQKI